MNEIIFLIENAAEGGYCAKALGYSIFTEADDSDSLKANIRDAVLAHFEDGNHPKIVRMHFVHEETFGIAK